MTFQDFGGSLEYKFKFLTGRLARRGRHFFKIIFLRIDLPEVVFLAVKGVFDRQQAGQHGVVLIVVAVEAVAADCLKIFKPVEVALDRFQVALVGAVIDGVGFGDAENAAVGDIGRFCQPDLFDFSLAEGDKVGVGHGPEGVVLVAEVFEAEAGGVGVGNHLGRPVFEVLDAADLHPWFMHVNPVVGEEVGAVDDEADRQEVAVAEAVGGGEDGRRRGRVEPFQKFGDGHTGNEIGAGDGLGAAVLVDDDVGDRVSGTADADDAAFQVKLPALLLNLFADGLPHLAGAAPGIVEGFDEAGDSAVGLDEHTEQGTAEGEVFDALGGPFGFEFGAGNSPHFFGVGFEEGFKEPFAEAVGDPMFEALFFRVGEEMPAEVAEEDAEGFQGAEVAHGVEGAEGVVVVFVVEVDAGEAGAAQEVGAEDGVPELLDFGRLGKKAVAAHVEVVAFVLFGAGNAANFIEFLEDGGGVALAG